MSTFWSLWIIVGTILGMGVVLWVLLANRRVAVNDEGEPENKKVGHAYDGIEEYDNPLPKWWFNLFIFTMIYAAVYLIFYPGLGNFGGVLGWTSTKELQHDQEQARERYADTFREYSNTPIPELALDPKAMKMGVRLFSNNCAVCHGADGGGNYSFPNLTDKDWLYGGDPDSILHSIAQGRVGNMPPWSAVLSEEQIAQVSDYVLSLSGLPHNAAVLEDGALVYGQICASCHGADAKGNTALGAPNLTDDVWLYEGTRESIGVAIRKGRVNEMPAQIDLLREEKIHILAAYVYSLSLDQN